MATARQQRGNRLRSAGQSVIVFVLAAVAAFAFVGLVIDGANLYRWRRAMQNCADAAALAGARIAVDATRTNAQVLSALQSYASQNAQYSSLESYYISEDDTLGAVSSYDSASPIPAAATGLHVIARKSVPVMFGFVLGASAKAVAAQAMAVFGPCECAVADQTVFPIAVEDDILTAVSSGDLIDFWDSDKVVDASGNEIGGDRGWLNLDYVYSAADPDSRTTSTNHSNSKLTLWATSGKSPAITIIAGSVGGLDADFINGDPGTRASAISAAGTRIGDTVLIPIFDTAYTKAQMQAESGFDTPGIGWANNSYYHIVGFAHFVITAVQSSGNPKYIRGRFVAGGSTVLDCGVYVEQTATTVSGDDDDDDDDAAGDDDDDDVASAEPVDGGIVFVGLGGAAGAPESTSAEATGQLLLAAAGGDDDDDDDTAGDDDDDAAGDDDDDAAGDDDDDVSSTEVRYESDESALCVSLVDDYGGGRIPVAASGDDDDDDAAADDDDDASGDDDDDAAADDDDDASGDDDDDAAAGDDDDDDSDPYAGTAPNDPCPCGSGKKYRNCHGE